MGKSLVAPLKFVSIPRLELTAATLSVKISKFIQEELQYSINRENFWTDSQVVLGYLQNESKRFKVFVASRIQIIKEHSYVSQWQNVTSIDNPADHASRGIIGNKRHLMVQVFFGKPQMNGLLQQKFQKLTPIMILQSKEWQLSIWLTRNKIFCQFWSHNFQVG